MAEYAAYIFSRIEHPFVDERKNSILSMLESTSTDGTAFQQAELSWEEYILEYEFHEGGCSAAQYLFSTHGTRYIPTFSRANTTQAKELLSELGWTTHIFIPYSEMEIGYTEK